MFFFSSRRRHTRSKRDWSSDVCSSDLSTPQHSQRRVYAQLLRGPAGPVRATFRNAEGKEYDVEMARSPTSNNPTFSAFRRSEERRVGKECRCRWSPDPKKENKVKLVYE